MVEGVLEALFFRDTLDLWRWRGRRKGWGTSAGAVVRATGRGVLIVMLHIWYTTGNDPRRALITSVKIRSFPHERRRILGYFYAPTKLLRAFSFTVNNLTVELALAVSLTVVEATTTAAFTFHIHHQEL